MAFLETIEVRIGGIATEALREYELNQSVEDRAEARDQGLETIAEGEKYNFNFDFGLGSPEQWQKGIDASLQGVEILAVKEFLGEVVDSRLYEEVDRGIFGDRRTRTADTPESSVVDRNVPISMADGPLFDEKMTAALTIWQTNRRADILAYGMAYLGWREEEEFNPSSFGEASFAIAHGWTRNKTHFYSEGYGLPPSRVNQETSEIRDRVLANPPSTPSALYRAAVRVAELIHETAPKDAAGAVKGKKPEDVKKAKMVAMEKILKPTPAKNSRPWESPAGNIGVYVDTEFTLRNPPSFSTLEQMRQYFLSKEREALSRVFDYYSKAHTWEFNKDGEIWSDTGTPMETIIEASRYYDVERISTGQAITINENESSPAMMYDQFELEYNNSKSGNTLVWAETGTFMRPLDWTKHMAHPNHSKHREMGDMTSLIAMVMTPPGGRPGDVYRMQFWVHQDRLRMVSSTGGTRFTPGDVVAQAVLNYDRAKAALGAASEFVSDPGAAIAAAHDNLKDRADRAADAAKDKIQETQRYVANNKKKVARNVWKKWRQDTERRQRDQRFASAESAAQKILEQRKGSSFDDPSFRNYEARNFKKYIETVAEKMDEYNEELKEWQKASLKGEKSSGGTFIPILDLSVEAKNLRACIPAVERVLEKNGFKLRDKFGESIKIKYISDKDDTSEKNVLGALIAEMYFTPAVDDGLLGTRAGAAFVGGDFQTPEENAARRIFITRASEEYNSHLNASDIVDPATNAQIEERNSYFAKMVHPFNNPRTMAYLMQLEEMYKFINKPADWGSSCDDVLMPKSIPFAVKFTYPAPGIKPRTPDNYGKPKPGPGSFEKSAMNLDSSVLKMMGGIKTAGQAVAEQVAISAENKEALIKVEKGKTYDINDLLPLGELCTWEEIWAKVLNKFDFKTMLCEWAQCLAIPWPIDFEWKGFDFEWPKIPVLDLYMLYPIIVANLLEMLIRILCTIINKLLDMIRLPNCDDLFNAAVYGISSINDATQEYYNLKNGNGVAYFNATADVNPINAEFLRLIKAQTPAEVETQKRYIQNLANHGVSAEHLSENGIDGAAVAELVESVSRVLTPTELCALLQGALQDSALDIVREIITSTQPSLSSFFRTNDAVTQFFSSLGGLLGQEVCDLVGRMPDGVLQPGRCDDGSSLRDYLASGGADAAQITNALAIAKAEADRRADLARTLASNNPMDMAATSLLDFSDPNAVVSDIPPAYMEILKDGVDSVLRIPKSTFNQEIPRYTPALYETQTRGFDFRDPEFNGYYRIQAEIAIKVLSDFESYLPMLMSDRLEGKWEARNALYTSYRYQYVGEQRVTEIDLTSEAGYRYVYKRQTIPVPTVDSLIENYQGDVQKWLEDQDLIDIRLENEGLPMGSFMLKPKDMGDVIDLGQYEEDTSESLKPRTIRATTVGLSHSDNSLEEPQWVTKYEGITDVEQIDKIKLAASGRYGEAGDPMAKSDFIKEVMDDAQGRIEHLQSLIMRDLEINHKQRTESLISPEIKKIFQKSEEILRETQDAYNLRMYGSSSNLENFYPSDQGFVMKLPDKTGSEGRTTGGRLVYRENPLPPGYMESTVDTTVTDNVLLNSVLRITECDKVPEETIPNTGLFADFTPSPGQLYRPESLHHLFIKNIQNAWGYYGFESPLITDKMTDSGRDFHEMIHGSVYGSFQEVMFEKVFNQLASSPLFNPSDLKEIDNRLRGKATIDPRGCLSMSPGLIDFDKVVKNAIDMVQEEFRKPENSLSKLLPGTVGPFEKGMQTALVSMMVDVMILELALRGGIAFSVYSAQKLLNEPLFREYILQFIDSSLVNIALRGGDFRNVRNIFYRKLQDITGIPTDSDSRKRKALTEFLARKEIFADVGLGEDGSELAKNIDAVFGTKVDKIDVIRSIEKIPVPKYVNAHKWNLGGGLSPTRDFNMLQESDNAVNLPTIRARADSGAIRTLYLEPIQIKDVSDIKNKGRFYIETYMRLIGEGAGTEFESFSEEFNTFRDEFHGWLALGAAFSPHTAPRGHVRRETAAEEQAQFDRANEASRAISERLDELETVEPIHGANDDQYKYNQADGKEPPHRQDRDDILGVRNANKQMELVNTAELVAFIRASYHAGFNKELCDVVGAIYSEDPSDPCYMSPKQSYQFPTRLVKKRRKYLRIRNPGITFNINSQDQGLDTSGIKNARSKFIQAGGSTKNSATDRHHRVDRKFSSREAWKYYSIPGNYCKMSSDVRTSTESEPNEFLKALQFYGASPESEIAATAIDRKEFFSNLQIEEYVRGNYGLAPIKMRDYPDREEYNGGLKLVESMMDNIVSYGLVAYEGGVPEIFGSVAVDGAPAQVGMKYPTTNVDNEEVYPRLESGLGMKDVTFYNLDGEPAGVPSHPFDPDADWMQPTPEGEYDNLGEITSEVFHHMKGAGELVEQSATLSGGGRPKDIYEEWTEYVIDHEFYIFRNPGESFHHPDEMPAMLRLVSDWLLDRMSPRSTGGYEYAYHRHPYDPLGWTVHAGHNSHDEGVGRSSAVPSRFVDDFVRQVSPDIRDYGLPWTPLSMQPGRAWGGVMNYFQHEDTNLEETDMFAFQGNPNVSFYRSFRRNPNSGRPDMYPSSEFKGKLMSMGWTLCRPLGHSSLNKEVSYEQGGNNGEGSVSTARNIERGYGENSLELGANQYATPVRLLLTKVDYKHADQILHSEVYINYELPEVMNGAGISSNRGGMGSPIHASSEIAPALYNNIEGSACIFHLNATRKKYLQLGLNMLVKEYGTNGMRASSTLHDAEFDRGTLGYTRRLVYEKKKYYREESEEYARLRRMSRGEPGEDNEDEWEVTDEPGSPELARIEEIDQRLLRDDPIRHAELEAMFHDRAEIYRRRETSLESYRQLSPAYSDRYINIRDAREEEAEGLPQYSRLDGPAITVSKVYSAGAWMEAWNGWWDMNDTIESSLDRPVTEDKEIRVDSLLYKERRGVLLTKSTLEDAGGWAVVLNEYERVHGAGLPSNHVDRIQNERDIKSLCDDYLDTYVDCRRYEGFWGRTSSPWWLWGGNGYYTGFRGVRDMASERREEPEVEGGAHGDMEWDEVKQRPYRPSPQFRPQYSAVDIFRYGRDILLDSSERIEWTTFDGFRKSWDPYASILTNEANSNHCWGYDIGWAPSVAMAHIGDITMVEANSNACRLTRGVRTEDLVSFYNSDGIFKLLGDFYSPIAEAYIGGDSPNLMEVEYDMLHVVGEEDENGNTPIDFTMETAESVMSRNPENASRMHLSNATTAAIHERFNILIRESVPDQSVNVVNSADLGAWVNITCRKPRMRFNEDQWPAELVKWYPSTRQVHRSHYISPIGWHAQHARSYRGKKSGNPSIRGWPDLWNRTKPRSTPGIDLVQFDWDDSEFLTIGVAWVDQEVMVGHLETLPVENHHGSLYNSPASYETPALTAGSIGGHDFNPVESISYQQPPLSERFEEVVFGDTQVSPPPSEEEWNNRKRKIFQPALDIKAGIDIAASLRDGSVPQGFSIYARLALINLLLRGEQTEMAFWAVLNTFATPESEIERLEREARGEPEAMPQGIFEELNHRLSEQMRSRIITLFEQTRYYVGARLVYIMPEEEGVASWIPWEGNNDVFAKEMQRVVAREERSWLSTYKDLSDDELYRARCIPLVVNELPIDMKCHFAKFEEKTATITAGVMQGLYEKDEFKMLTEYAFPVERYASMSCLYSIMALSQKEEMRETLANTKASIARLMKMMASRPPFGNSISVLDGGTFRQVFMGAMSPDGPQGLPDFMMDKFGDFIGDLIYNALMTPPWLIRSLAAGLDPAYKEMKNLAMQPKCELDALNWSSVTKTAVDRKMYKGIDRDKRAYAPVSTAFPYDLLYRGTQFAPPFVNKNFFKALGKFANFIAKDKMPPPPKVSAGNREADMQEYEALLERVNDRYGTFLGPFGLIALGIPPQPGEEDMYGSAAGCPDPTTGDERPIPPPCDDLSSEDE